MAKAGKLPKRIAGVKMPKALRKRGGALYRLANQPMVRNVLADMIAAGLLAAADAIAKQTKAKKAGKAAKRAVDEGAHTAQVGAIDLGTILAFAAREGARAIKSNSRR